MPTKPVPATAHQPTVLVVDDDEALRLLVGAALGQDGMRVLDADAGSAALTHFATRRPDVILLDVMMPGISGFDVCTQIRQQAGGEHVPILMMTGLDDVASINRAYDAGATDFITKPVNYAILAHRVRYMLRASRLADELRAQDARLARAQNMARLGHWEWNLKNNEIMCTDLMEQWFGLRNGARIAGYQDLLRNVHEDDLERLDQALRDGFRDHSPIRLSYRLLVEGETIHIDQDATFTRTSDSGALCYTGVVQDVSERVRAEQRAHEFRNVDEVTGLPNRFAVKQEVTWAIEVARRYSRTLAVMTLDLDQFKRINDSLGFEFGDGVLREVAARLVSSVRQTDIVEPDDLVAADAGEVIARLGGDEFVIVLSDIRSADDASAVAQRIRAALAAPILIGDEQVVVSASFGISTYPNDGDNVDDLLKHAGAALNAAKREGRDRDQFYSATLDARAFQRFSMEADLRNALSAGELELWYQPKLRVSDGSVSGAEALIRWRHPQHGLVSPTEFIPIAEDTGLIAPIGLWIVDTAVNQLAAWNATPFSDLRVAINLSASQFDVPGIEKHLINTTAAARVAPDRLELELTESVIMTDIDDTLSILHRLKEHGFRLWIDDFGTGYSSLSYLKRLPIQGLKIDQSFVRDMHLNSEDAAIVAAVCMLARGVDLEVIAEGVELREHAECLRELGCDYFQGYHYHKPMPATEFVAWVGRQRASHHASSAA